MYLRVLGHSFMKQLKRKYRQEQIKEYFQFSGHHNSSGRGGGGGGGGYNGRGGGGGGGGGGGSLI